MNLQKTLIKFYKKSLALNELRATLTSLKKINARVSKKENFSLEDIQIAINHHSKIKEITGKKDKLPSELLRIQRKIIKALKEVGVPTKKQIQVHDEQYGDMNFWFEGSRVYFQKLDLQQYSISTLH